MAKEAIKSEIQQDLEKTRQERAQTFAVYFKRIFLEWQSKTQTWITSATELGKLIGVSDVTANDWIRGKTIPRREQCIRIAQVFGKLMTEVLEAAGYNPTQDDSFNSFSALFQAVDAQSEWPAEKRNHIRASLIEAISPEFNFTTDEDTIKWRELSRLVLNRKIAPEAKAEQIEAIIRLWHQEQQSTEH